METELATDPSFWEWLHQFSLSLWLGAGVMLAAFLWFLKWAGTVLFLQGKGVGLVTVPISRMAGRIIEDKFAQKFADSKLLPKLYVPTNWEEFNRFNGHIAHRMRTYRELTYMVQAKFGGPSAVSLRIAVRFFEKQFVDTFRTAEAGFRELDKLDDAVRRVHRRILAELEETTGELERERVDTERQFEISRIRRKHLIAALPAIPWLERRMSIIRRPITALINLFRRTPDIRDLGRDKKELGIRLQALRKEITLKNRNLFASHQAEVLGVCMDLIQHDLLFLKHLYHVFGLEMESLTFTVASGRILSMLAEDNEEAIAARQALGLSDLVAFQTRNAPIDIDAIRAHIRGDSDLETYVGLGPEAVLEGALEPYLRVKLLLGKINLPGYSAHWIAHLPPPAEFGRAQAEYDHFSHQLGWLKKPLPGMKVAANGLVEIADPMDARESVRAAE